MQRLGFSHSPLTPTPIVSVLALPASFVLASSHLSEKDLNQPMKLTLKALTYWLVGDRTGRILTAIWNWLWGLPVEAGGKVAVEVAQESIYAMQQSVHKLAESIAQITASYQQANQKYEAKQQEFERAERQALLAQQQGNEAAARLAMGTAIAIERLLPQLADQVAQANAILMVQQERLSREQQRLETQKVEMQNLKDLSEVNEALAKIVQVNSDIGANSARSQFESAKSAVQGRYQQANTIAASSENLAEKAAAAFDQMTLDDEINQRLKQLNATEDG